MNTIARVLMKEKREREHILYDLDSGMQGCIQVYFTRTRAGARTFQLSPRSCVSNPYVIIPICEFVQN